ncbi:AMP-binding protein [Williamsia deligens]|uniref:AMP-binding protein n=1 Tax=Williamsia deligens TaxID=321325 RepID=A0ABW3GCV8_9NOCA|nr:AMP-binding protein [Williamsia deligens]MCP2192674.1 AMP-binding enzyme [Williamsia deligens]
MANPGTTTVHRRTLSTTSSRALLAVADDHRIDPEIVVAAGLVAYRGPGPATTAPRVGVAVSGGARIAPVDLPVSARHTVSGLIVRVGACVDAPVDPDPTVAPRDVAVAAGGTEDVTAALAAVPVVVWCTVGRSGEVTLELSTVGGEDHGDHLGRFVEFLGRFVVAGRAPVGSLQVVSEAERVHILDEWNATAELTAPATLVDLLEMGMSRDPDRAAVVTTDGVISHGDLDCYANRVARALLATGVSPGSVVGVLCESTPAAMVATLAVLRAGGSVLVLSTRSTAPETIVRIAEARATRVVTDIAAAAVVPPWVEIVSIDDEELVYHPDEPVTVDDGAGRGHLHAVAEVVIHRRGDELAALSTSHGALANRLAWTLSAWAGDRDADDMQVVVPVHAHKLRDVCDIIWTLVLGATAHVTVGHGYDRPLAGTGAVAEAGGAAFRTGEDRRPGWNVEAYVLDAHLRLVPPGTTGDLYVAGVQLAHGWSRDPSGTANHFVANPFRPGERMVRVGQVASPGGRTERSDTDVLRRVVAAVGTADAVGSRTARTDEYRPAGSGFPTR